jgi:hypothetical protein
MNRETAARRIQNAFRRKTLVLPRTTKNIITLENLGPLVIQAWNRPGGNRYYMNPSTFREIFTGGVYISPLSRAPASFMFRKAKFVGRSRKSLTQKNKAAARRMSRNINRMKRKRGNANMIPNNANGYVSENWNWQPPPPSPPRVPRRMQGGNQFTRYTAAGTPTSAQRTRRSVTRRLSTPARAGPPPIARPNRVRRRNNLNNFGSPNRN